MSSGTRQIEYRRLRAPREDRSALVQPPLRDVPELVAANLALRARHDYDFQGRSLKDLSRQARGELVQAAVEWTSSYRDVPVGAARELGKVFLAGHQPQLFHPGVWFKNFALGALADQQAATAINLIIDSDAIKSHALRVPGGSVQNPQATLLPFDGPGPVIPYEERAILDPAAFCSFGRRAAAQIAPLIPHPLAREFWPLARARAREGLPLGMCLAQARHQLEGQWGLSTLEVPQSRVCQLPAFAWFTAHLMGRLNRFRDVYNEAVAEYRRLHHIRSAAHPVPDLAAEGEWIEAPYWLWTRDDSRRRRAFVRRDRRQLVLSDRHGVDVALPCSEDGQLGPAVERLLELPGMGIRLRSRALVTTLWARLVLGDLFLHGIGGAKYDHVTDALFEGFYGLTPPGILVLSATLMLPVERRRSSPADARQLARRLRDLTWHADSVLATRGDLHHSPQAAELVAAKQHWIRVPQTPGNVQARWREIRRINEALQPWVADERQRLLAEQDDLRAALRAEAVLAWREYGFCLYPAAVLQEFLRDLLPEASFGSPRAR